MRTEEQKERQRVRAAKRRDAFRKQGLTGKGKPRKGTHKPNEAQRKFVVNKNPTFERKEPILPKKGETVEQRRARGFSIRGTPLARDIEERVRKRIEAMDE